MVDHSEESVRPRAVARATSLLWVIVIAIVIAFCYFASSLCITLVVAAFLAILVDPIVTKLEQWGLPRSFGSALVILAGVLFLVALGYVSYGKTSAFLNRVPQYVEKIRTITKPVTERIQKFQESAGQLNPAPKQKTSVVRVNEPTSFVSYLARGVGSVAGAIIVGAIVPFLTFFMLVRKDHINWWLNTTFGERTDVPKFVKGLGEMVRAYVIGNLIVGSIMATVTVGVLAGVKLEGAVTLGFASGFLNLVPYLGVVLASIIPLLAATLQFSTAGPFLVIVLTVVVLHLVSANLFIPKFIGSRVNIDPVAATVGMLFWAWLWGAVGLLLAVPLTAFVKLIADCHPSLIHISNLLAETPRAASRWAQAGQATMARAIPFFRDRFRITAKK